MFAVLSPLIMNQVIRLAILRNSFGVYSSPHNFDHEAPEFYGLGLLESCAEKLLLGRDLQLEGAEWKVQRHPVWAGVPSFQWKRRVEGSRGAETQKLVYGVPGGG